MSKKHVMIATPAFDGKVNISYLLSFTSTVNLLTQNEVDVTPLVVPSGSLLVAERNRIIKAFWNSECTHLLCIDSDLGWPSDSVLSMLNEDRDFIAGCYPARSEKDTFLFRPFLNSNKSIVQDKQYLKMQYIPAGFMLLNRECVRKLREGYPHLYFKPKDPLAEHEDGYCFFDTEVWEGEFWGEDYVFCRRLRNVGVDLWVDPTIEFNHAGKVGKLLDALTTDPSKAAIPHIPVPQENQNNNLPRDNDQEAKQEYINQTNIIIENSEEEV